jgi:23S rRNA pseudouridine1911/1915/1917 synthase
MAAKFPNRAAGLIRSTNFQGPRFERIEALGSRPFIVSESIFEVPEQADQLRLDQCLAQCVPGLSRRMARVIIDLGGVFIDRKRVKVASRKVFRGQVIAVHRGGAFERATKATGREARARDEATLPTFRVLFEDDHLVAVDKPSGLLSAPTPESDRNNLLNLLAEARPQVFVVHRLDLQASGVMIFAKSEAANQKLADLFREHTLTRRYDVLAAGVPPESTFRVEVPVRGKPAATDFQCLEALGRFSHLEATLHTGRTHQIRLHLLHAGIPVLADPRYAQRADWHPPRLALHAKLLELAHPASGETLTLTAPLPPELDDWLAAERALAAQAAPVH